MVTISAEHTISMGHRLPQYPGNCSSPHGHNMRVEVTIDTSGKFIDFKEVRDKLIQTLEPMDHAMCLWAQDPLLPVLREMGFRVVPLVAEPTTEYIAEYLYDQLSRYYYVLEVVVHETDRYSARMVRTP